MCNIKMTLMQEMGLQGKKVGFDLKKKKPMLNFRNIKNFKLCLVPNEKNTIPEVCLKPKYSPSQMTLNLTRQKNLAATKFSITKFLKNLATTNFSIAKSQA
eukprot:TRINITY_DN9537_c0_g1_i2.p3 TRINITY_DN9537_c0_g1~~TRINITY_DN9537_c0_g1_i2.p3  ORF type:complete len:113 (+),score=7.14 TRINITY_DN9537_c0_g1_i2:39-341(+)